MPLRLTTRRALHQKCADMAKSEYKMDFSRPIMERYSIVMVKHGCCEMCVPILY